jgi:hypothetical protein
MDNQLPSDKDNALQVCPINFEGSYIPGDSIMFFLKEDMDYLFGGRTGWVLEVTVAWNTYFHLKDGIVHNEKGPAVIGGFAGGVESTKYYLDGKRLSEGEWTATVSRKGCIYYG